MDNRIYIAIDLKSFYASVECVERGLDPLDTNLVVADEGRTEKTICLAVSPALKSFGVPGRPRLFEVAQKVRQVNNVRKYKTLKRELTGESHFISELQKEPSLAISYIVAPPQMSKYIEISKHVYEIYLRYIAPEDIHVYSIDEVFIDITSYLKTYRLTPRQLTMKLIKEVLSETGVTATAGIGTNMYLAKIAMDIVAKKMPADRDGVRIAAINEMSYRRHLWTHQPLTDFWRVGAGYAKKLEAHGYFTMGDIARASLSKYDENLLYKLFGVNAELLIDHAWGWEPCTIADIKQYKPENNSISQGQVLHCPYSFDKGLLIVREMTDLLVLDLVSKGLVTDQIILTVGYDISDIPDDYEGIITKDHYGRKVPKSAHGSANLGRHISSTKIILEKVTELYKSIVDSRLKVRRMYVVANHVIAENSVKEEEFVQLDFFTDYAEKQAKNQEEKKQLKKEKQLQKAMIMIKDRYGKNAILKGMNYLEGATTKDRNRQVGGHKA